MMTTVDRSTVDRTTVDRSTVTTPLDHRHAVIDSVLGELTLVRDDIGLTAIYFPGHWTRPDRNRFGSRVDADGDEVFAATTRQLHDYLAGDRQEFDLPLHLVGSDSARALWGLLQQIPYGQTTTYGSLAAELGTGISARAVGGFVGHNPVSMVVPCHRVVGADGKLTGYAGGIERKQHLLELEGSRAGTTLPLH